MGANKSTFLEKEGELPEERLKHIGKNPAQFWPVLVVLSKKKNDLAGWNFCYVAHRILSVASATDICQLKFKINVFQNLGSDAILRKSNSYGVLIFHYAALLTGRLKFHNSNPNVSGKFSITIEELMEKITTRAELQTFVDQVLNYRDKNLAVQDAILLSAEQNSRKEKRLISQTTPLALLFKDYCWISKLLKHVDEIWPEAALHNYFETKTAQNNRFEVNWGTAKDYYHLPEIKFE